MSRNAQISRQWRLWLLLSSQAQSMSAAELAEHLQPEEVSARTVRRDLEVLRSIGVPVRVVRDGRTVRYQANDDGPAIRIDGSTLLALRLAFGLLHPFRATPVGEALGQLERQLQAQVPPRSLAHFSALAQTVVVKGDAPPDYGQSGGVLALLHEALSRQRTLVIDYNALNGRQGRRVVHPQGVAYGPHGLYLFALDELSGGQLRTFRVERIRSAQVGAAPRRLDPSFDAEEHVAGSLGIFSPEHEPRRFVLRVHEPALVRALQENPWHPSQQLAEVAREGHEVSFVLRSSRELLGKVLQHGSALEVLEPAEFREEVAGRLREASARYGPPSPRIRRGSRSWSDRRMP